MWCIGLANLANVENLPTDRNIKVDPQTMVDVESVAYVQISCSLKEAYNYFKDSHTVAVSSCSEMFNRCTFYISNRNEKKSVFNFTHTHNQNLESVPGQQLLYCTKSLPENKI